MNIDELIEKYKKEWRKFQKLYEDGLENKQCIIEHLVQFKTKMYRYRDSIKDLESLKQSIKKREKKIVVEAYEEGQRSSYSLLSLCGAMKGEQYYNDNF